MPRTAASPSTDVSRSPRSSGRASVTIDVSARTTPAARARRRWRARKEVGGGGERGGGRDAAGGRGERGGARAKGGGGEGEGGFQDPPAHLHRPVGRARPRFRRGVFPAGARRARPPALLRPPLRRRGGQLDL